MPLTKDQVAHLNQRITDAFNARRYPAEPASVPPEIKKAQAAIEAYNEKATKAAARRIAAVTAARRAAQEAVLSGDWASALAAVKKFETTPFN